MDATIGTNDNDVLTVISGHHGAGLAGDDILSSKKSGISDCILFGGTGNDTYNVTYGTSCVVVECGNSYDVVNIKEAYKPYTSTYGYIVDDNVLAIYDKYSGTSVFFVNYNSPEWRVEQINFTNKSFTFESLLSTSKNIPHYYSSSEQDTSIVKLIAGYRNLWTQFAEDALRAESPPLGFNELWYDKTYTDISNAIDNGFIISGSIHFMDYGKNEGRDPNKAFDTDYYLEHNKDVAAAVHSGAIAAYDHFVDYGQFEGRRPSEAFSEAGYLAANPDVVAAVKAGAIQTGYQHFAQYGQYEGRSLGVIGVQSHADIVDADMAGA